MVARLRLFALLVASLAVLAACGTPQTPVKVELSVAVVGTGAGTVTSNPAGIDTGASDLAAEFNEGTTVTLTAVAASGSTFAGFTGATCEAGSAADTCVITLDEATDVTATFTLVPAGTEELVVNVVTAGGAAGSVTSEPAGIDVTAGSDSGTFDVGTTVTLTADATAEGFAGWTGGDCDGLKTLVCEVVMDVDEPAVTAIFNDVTTLTVTVAANTDDAVEFLADSDTDPVNNPEGWVWAEWQRFDLGFDPNHAQTEVGLRFPNLGIPAGANVLDAALQLSAYGISTGTTGDFSLAVRGQLAADAAGFPEDPDADPSFGITGRTTRTTASTTWDISGAWVIDTAYESPPITAVVSEIVALPGWTADGHVVLFLSNVDPLNEESRRVWSFDGVGAGDPRLPTLLIEYVALPPAL